MRCLQRCAKHQKSSLRSSRSVDFWCLRTSCSAAVPDLSSPRCCPLFGHRVVYSLSYVTLRFREIATSPATFLRHAGEFPEQSLPPFLASLIVFIHAPREMMTTRHKGKLNQWCAGIVADIKTRALKTAFDHRWRLAQWRECRHQEAFDYNPWAGATRGFIAWRR